MEFGTFGLLFAGSILVAIVTVKGVTSTRLQRVGAYLLGGGIGGTAILLSAIVRIRNVCGTPGGQVQTPSGTSYACYPIETVRFFLPYAVLVCLGAVILFLAWKRRYVQRS
ncbi:MAG: hypothetical protein E6J32_10440 [Chloroflexi bacterium]|nr:MAG: hypothetical protein E6J32_10440 [Chloroflexota bacterium]